MGIQIRQQRLRAAFDLAGQVSHPFSLGYVLNVATRLHHYRRESQAVREQAEAVLALSTEQGFAQWLVVGNLAQGWALAQQDHGAEGIALIQQGLAAHQALGAKLYMPYYLALLAEAFGKMGQVQEGLRTLEEALDVVERTEERWYEAELYRLRGELLLNNDECRMMNDERRTEEAKSIQHAAEAEASFHTAIEVARQQEAKSLELRAAMSLARLWQSQGKTSQARNLLAPVYNWFTEGFGTADLKDAKALLEQLSEDV